MQLSLIIEKNVFNFLMYIILLIGGLVAIGVDILGSLVDPRVYGHNLVILTGVMAAGALCHFLHHRSAAYLARDENSEFLSYEYELNENELSKTVVGITNFIILAILSVEFVRSYSMMPTEGSIVHGLWYKATCILFFSTSMIIFMVSKKSAKNSWKKL